LPKTSLKRTSLKRKRGRPARRIDHVGPTPETLAKLRQDPLLALLERYDSDSAVDDRGALEKAANEIRAVYIAVCGMLMAGIGGGHRYGQGPGGRREIPPFIAWVHAETYRPWASGTKRATLEAVIDLVVDRAVIHPDLYPAAAAALADYAARMRRRRAFRDVGQEIE
jgi:hypothetical protein